MSVDEWGEYIAYGGDEIKVARSYRVYNDKGELVSTGIEWDVIPRKPNMDVEQEVEKARKRLSEKMKKIKDDVVKKYGQTL
jgi:hypothetical protein